MDKPEKLKVRTEDDVLYSESDEQYCLGWNSALKALDVWESYQQSRWTVQDIAEELCKHKWPQTSQRVAEIIHAKFQPPEKVGRERLAEILYDYYKQLSPEKWIKLTEEEKQEWYVDADAIIKQLEAGNGD